MSREPCCGDRVGQTIIVSIANDAVDVVDDLLEPMRIDRSLIDEFVPPPFRWPPDGWWPRNAEFRGLYVCIAADVSSFESTTVVAVLPLIDEKALLQKIIRPVVRGWMRDVETLWEGPGGVQHRSLVRGMTSIADVLLEQAASFAEVAHVGRAVRSVLPTGNIRFDLEQADEMTAIAFMTSFAKDRKILHGPLQGASMLHATWLFNHWMAP